MWKNDGQGTGERPLGCGLGSGHVKYFEAGYFGHLVCLDLQHYPSDGRDLLREIYPSDGRDLLRKWNLMLLIGR